jgi:hypothetical protein
MVHTEIQIKQPVNTATRHAKPVMVEQNQLAFHAQQAYYYLEPLVYSTVRQVITMIIS